MAGDPPRPPHANTAPTPGAPAAPGAGQRPPPVEEQRATFFKTSPTNLNGILGLRVEIAPKTILFVLGIFAAIWILGQLITVLSVILVALVLVGTFDPLVAWLERRGIKRGRSLVLVFVGAGLALSALALLMVPPLLAQFSRLIADAPASRARLVNALAGFGWADPLVAAINDLPLDKLKQQVATMMLGYSTVLFEGLAYGMSTLFLTIYLLADPTRSKGLLYAVTPRHFHVKMAKMLLELKIIVGGYMRGQLITSAAIAAFVLILLLILRADNALPLALFAGLTDLIPFVGGYIASTPVIVSVTPHGVTTTLIVLVLMVLYQEFESRILVPRVYGRVLRLPPAIVLVALLIGATLAGILGALLALPIAAGMQMVVRELRVELPGEKGIGERALALDQRASVVYEQLAEGVDAAEAGKIADNLAASVKKSEDATPPRIKES